MDLPSAARTTRQVVCPRNPLATARPGLDYLRAAFVARWESDGSVGAGEAATAFVVAAAGTPEAQTEVAAIARWIARNHASRPAARLSLN